MFGRSGTSPCRVRRPAAAFIALGVLLLLIACSDPPPTRDIVIVNLDPDVRIVHVVGSQSELGWFRIEGDTQVSLGGVPTRTGLEFTAFGVDCNALSTTGYPIGSDQDHGAVVERGQLVLEDAPSPRPLRGLVRVGPCET
jgi:hypothetical protein